MPTSALRDRLRDALVEFAWDEWAQMGVFAPARVRSPWAQDPEALIVLTLEVGRYDPRLFDELLDWLSVNDGTISTRRLRTVCVDEEDRALVDAAIAWLAASRRGGPAEEPVSSTTERLLFHELPRPLRRRDPVFAAHGFLRPEVEARGRSAAPDPRLPINLAFRLRHLLGMGARAEVVRALLTIDSPRISTSDVARTAAFARQNVHDALASFRTAGVVSSVAGGSDQRYWTDRARWATLFGVETDEWPPQHRDWPALLGALRTILRWLEATPLEELSEYMRGSRTREMVERVAPAVAYSGITIESGGTSAEAPAALERLVDRALALLAPDGSRAHQSSGGAPARIARIRIEASDHGKRVWVLRAANGRSVARSMESFDTDAAASDAARAFVDRAGALEFVVSDVGDGVRWKAGVPGDAVVARSVDRFASRSNAVRAIEQVRRLLGESSVVLDPAR